MCGFERTKVLGCDERLQFHRGRGTVTRFVQHATEDTVRVAEAKLYNLSSRMYGSLVSLNMAGVCRQTGVADDTRDQRFLTAGVSCKLYIA